MSNNSNDPFGKQATPSEESMKKDRGTEEREIMTIEFENPAEAFAAVATVVIATDNLGTMSERDFLFEQVKYMDMFTSYTQAEFTKLLGDAIDKAYGTLPMDGASIAQPGIDSLAQSIRKVLSPELQVQAFEMAFGLACADRLCDKERTLLERLQHGLEIDDPVAQNILGSAT